MQGEVDRRGDGETRAAQVNKQKQRGFFLVFLVFTARYEPVSYTHLVVVLEGEGTIRTLNNKAQAMLGLPPDAVHNNIQDIIFSSDIIRAILSESGQFSDQEAFLQLKGGSLNCMLSLTRLESGKGRVLTLRETKRIKESAVRVTGAKAVYTFDHIVGNAPATQEVVRMARMAAQSDVTTLILGESGTGKELFAQSIHNGGRRANAPFVVVNCGALPRNLVQSELFGYDEGSFTGASRLGKPGKFELADNGTIFLDEIGEMPLEAQDVYKRQGLVRASA